MARYALTVAPSSSPPSEDDLVVHTVDVPDEVLTAWVATGEVRACEQCGGEPILALLWPDRYGGLRETSACSRHAPQLRRLIEPFLATLHRISVGVLVGAAPAPEEEL